MKQHKNKSLYTSMFIVVLLIMSGIVNSDNDGEPDDWDVPNRYKHMENPVETDNQSTRIGRSLYRRNCRDCHGSTGGGDGPEAADLETPIRDFGSEEVQNQSDGELFYKTSDGRDEMPGFKSDMYEEDIWHIVNYIRTLKEE